MTAVEHEEFSLPRSRDVPLVFVGRLLGTGELGRSFWTRVQLYETRGGSYVVHVLQGSHHDDNAGESTATVCKTIPAMLEAMKDRQGKLGGASMQALAEAANRDPRIRELASERVE